MEVATLVAEYLKVLAWPITIIVLVALFRVEVRTLLKRVRKADLPGGVSVDLMEQIEEARHLSEKVEAAPKSEKHKGPTIPLTEANARMLSLGLRPSPSGLDMAYYRTLAAQDPALALAGLRIEIDILARNLAKGFKVPADLTDAGIRLLRRLNEVGAITSDQFQLAGQVMKLCNAAVHGQLVSQEAANSVINIASVLAEQYLAWLSWGFGDDWMPTRPASGPGV
jgi:hypothetical protein